MGYINELINSTKEAIATNFNNSNKYKKIFKIIDGK